MYGHYFLTSIGVKNAPWRPYITSMQLAQFLAILGQNVTAWLRGRECGQPDWYKVVMLAYMASMLLLFTNFYVRIFPCARVTPLASRQALAFPGYACGMMMPSND